MHRKFGLTRELSNYRAICQKFNETLIISADLMIVQQIFQLHHLHNDDNLICLCDSCHQNLHLSKFNLLGYISEMRCNKLLELLETLKEKYKNDKTKLELVEFSIKSISSQASDIEEGSTTIPNGSTLQANGNGSEKCLTSEDNDIV